MSVMRFVLLLLTALTSYSSTLIAAQPTITSATPVVTYMPIVLDNPDFFEFTGEQKEQIIQLAATVNAQREPLDQAILDMRHELRIEQAKYHPDDQLVVFLAKEIQQSETKRLSLSIDCANGLRRILTAEQWGSLIELSE